MKMREVPERIVSLRNGHQFVATARRLGIPMRQARASSKALQLVRSPVEYRTRRSLARRLLQEVTPPARVQDGFAAFEGDLFPFGNAALKVCQDIAEEEKSSFTLEPDGKGFLRTLLTPKRLLDCREILEFATSRELVATVTEYLGTIPVLSDIRLWWSVPSSSRRPSASQQFHRDHEDYRQLKVFLNVYEITDDAGPFTFFPARASEEIIQHSGSRFGRLEDEEVMSIGSVDDLIVLTGPAGMGAMVDTSRCLHFGSRNEKAERLLLMLHFLSYHSIVEPDTKVLTDQVRATWKPHDPLVATLMRRRPWGMGSETF